MERKGYEKREEVRRKGKWRRGMREERRGKGILWGKHVKKEHG